MYAMPTICVGTSLQSGRYIITQLLGQGGMGTAYLANDTRLSYKNVVVKVMKGNTSNTLQMQKDIQNFASEVAVLSHLSHPLIPHVSDHFQEGMHYCMVQEYVQGEDLQSYLYRLGHPLPEFEVLTYMSEILDILVYLAHQSLPIIHRDIKPANIIISTRDQRAHLVDFGIARATESGNKQTTVLGTPGYIPPEQYQGRAEHRSDLYALGATAHHLLTNHDPQQEPPFTYAPVRQLNPTLSKEIENVLKKALFADINHRYTSADEFKQTVDSLLLQQFGANQQHITGFLKHMVQSLMFRHGKATQPLPANYVLMQNGVPSQPLSKHTTVGQLAPTVYAPPLAPTVKAVTQQVYISSPPSETQKQESEDEQEYAEILRKLVTAFQAIEETETLQTHNVGRPINITLTGCDNVFIDSTSGGSVNISGVGDCTINYLDGNRLQINLSGAGDVHIRSGHIFWLDVNLSGTGSVRGEGLIADNANLSISGTGDISVGRVIDNLNCRRSGIGSINVYERG